MCNCRFGGTAENNSEDEMTQCLHWVTDAYNEFLMSGVLSDERFNRLQMVYDKLKTSEMTDSAGMQMLPDITKMIGTSIPSAAQIPSLLNMSIPPLGSAMTVPTVGAAEPNTLSGTMPGRQHERSRSRRSDKPLLPTPDTAESKAHTNSPDSHASSGLANSVTMEFGSENGGGPYSPFDSPFSLTDANPPFAASREARTSEFGFGGSIEHTQEAPMTDHGTAGEPPSSSPPGSSAGGDRSRVRLPPPPPPRVLSPQEILAGRISDEIALVEVLVRIQFELASIGDLPAEDAAVPETEDTGEPLMEEQDPSSIDSPLITAAVLTSAKSFLGDLPALPSPGSLQEMIGQSNTPTSTTQSPAATTISAAVSQTAVSLSHSGKALPSTDATVKGKMPYTPPTVCDSTPSITAAADTPAATKQDTVASGTSATTKSQPVSLQHTDKSSRRHQPKTPSTSTNSDPGNKSTSKDGSEKVFHRLACHFLSTYFTQLKTVDHY